MPCRNQSLFVKINLSFSPSWFYIREESGNHYCKRRKNHNPYSWLFFRTNSSIATGKNEKTSEGISKQYSSNKNCHPFGPYSGNNMQNNIHGSQNCNKHSRAA